MQATNKVAIIRRVILVDSFLKASVNTDLLYQVELGLLETKIGMFAAVIRTNNTEMIVLMNK
jgi:hypothetical protein